MGVGRRVGRTGCGPVSSAALFLAIRFDSQHFLSLHFHTTRAVASACHLHSVGGYCEYNHNHYITVPLAQSSPGLGLKKLHTLGSRTPCRDTRGAETRRGGEDEDDGGDGFRRIPIVLV